MRKLINLIMSLLVFTFSFSFKISELEFSETLGIGIKKSKKYTLTNNNNLDKLYSLRIEGDNNIKITPNILNLKALNSKDFIIEVSGKGKKGRHEYFLVIKEINKNKNKEGIALNKIIKIKQNYIIK